MRKKRKSLFSLAFFMGIMVIAVVTVIYVVLGESVRLMLEILSAYVVAGVGGTLGIRRFLSKRHNPDDERPSAG